LNDQSANVSGPMSAYCAPAMMRRKFIGETTQKVVRLANIYRMPGAYGRGLTEDVSAWNGEVCRPDWVKPKIV
jgi:hypothetical protein